MLAFSQNSSGLSPPAYETCILMLRSYPARSHNTRVTFVQQSLPCSLNSRISVCICVHIVLVFWKFRNTLETNQTCGNWTDCLVFRYKQPLSAHMASV